MRLRTKAYIGALAILALTLALAPQLNRVALPLPPAWLVLLFVGLVALAITFPLSFDSDAKLSLHTSVVFAAVLIFPPRVALAVVALGVLLGHVALRRPLVATLFNLAQIALQVACGGLLLVYAGWQFDPLIANQPWHLLTVLLVASVMYTIELLCMLGIMQLQQRQAFSTLWKQLAGSAMIEAVAQFGLGLLAAVVVDAYPWALPALLPLVWVVHRSSTRYIQILSHSETLAHQAFHDALTQLPNRALFADRLQHALAQVQRQHMSIGVLLLDLDHFKVINDSLGHAAGDALLQLVSRRLAAVVRPGDTLARFGGDEFTLLLIDLNTEEEAVAVAERLMQALQAPFLVDEHPITVTTSIGIALNRPDLASSEDVLRAADLALYRAKDQGKGRYVVFDDNLSTVAMERLQLEADLRRAIVDEEIRVYYQPVVHIQTGRITGVEALVRWDHPRRGLIPPSQFISIAEETGLIVPLGRIVLQQACRQVRAWHLRYPHHSDLMLCVNLSPRQFQHVRLLHDINQILGETKLSPHCLEFEITEGMLMGQEVSDHNTLAELKKLGTRLAIDDFGTGYSSLAYLQRFPIDTIKIDRTFIDNLGPDDRSVAIVRAVVTLAKTLDMAVIAEGIETRDQKMMLQTLGCDQGQGFYFAKPQSGSSLLSALMREAPYQLLEVPAVPALAQIERNG